MKVFIAGATGVIGRQIVRKLTAQGFTVVGLARTAIAERTLTALGAEFRQVDLFSADALARAAENCEVVIHVATAIPVKNRTSPDDWKMNDTIRREGTATLAECATRIGAKLYIQQSVAALARPVDGGIFDEDSPTVPGSVLTSARDGEEIAQEAGEKGGFPVAVLRCGWLYGDEARHTMAFAESLRRRQVPVLENGGAILSCIHQEDAGSAFVAAVKALRGGLWHVVDDCPVSLRDFLVYFAEQLMAPKPMELPLWLARVLAGVYRSDLFSTSCLTSNARFRRDFAWTPRYPSYREGIEQVVESWSFAESRLRREGSQNSDEIRV